MYYIPPSQKPVKNVLRKRTFRGSNSDFLAFHAGIPINSITEACGDIFQ